MKSRKEVCKCLRLFKGIFLDPLALCNLFALEACATLAPRPSNLQGTPSGAVMTPSLVASAFGFLSPPGRRTRAFGITASFGKHDASAHALRRASGVAEGRGAIGREFALISQRFVVPSYSRGETEPF